ncbi:hypothetical protein HDV05_002636, partial [Chytridiales sp. JEL 0842]
MKNTDASGASVFEASSLKAKANDHKEKVDFDYGLQEDVRLLSQLCMQTIKEHPGIADGTPDRLAAIIERLLEASKLYHACRMHNTDKEITDAAFATLTNLIRQLESPTDLFETSRGFNEFLALAELAEREHRIRRWRGYRRGESGLLFKQTCLDAFGDLQAKGFTQDEIRNALLKQNVGLVLTAHPTQA